MSKVFVSIGLSLDGYLAPEGMTMSDPNHMGWGAKWGAMMGWIVNTQYFRENLRIGSGGDTGPINAIVRIDRVIDGPFATHLRYVRA